MSEDTPNKPQVTEYDAMQAWGKLVEGGKVSKFVATGVAVRDPSSQMPDPKDVDQAIRWGLVHN